MHLLIDLITVLFGCGVVYIAYRKGFLTTVISLVGYLAAAFLAMVLADMLANALYEVWLGDTVRQTVAECIGSTVPSRSDVSAVVDSIYQRAPGLVGRLIQSNFGSGEQLAESISASVGGSVDRAVDAVVETAVRPLVITLAKMLAFIPLFFLLMIAVKCLAKLFRGINALPLVGGLNRLLGGAVGVVQAALSLLLLAVAVRIFVDLTGNSNEFLNSAVIERTFIFDIFYRYNPFVQITLF